LQVPIQFDFLNPSARSLALGSAFVALADDATASLVNPAGLIALTRPEVSFEVRYRRFEQPFLTGGRLSGEPTGMGVDRIAGPQFTTIGDTAVAPAFVSAVLPRGRLRVAGFRHELLGLEQRFASQGVFQWRGFDNRDTASSAVRTLDVDTYGASAAYEFRRLWLGGSLLIQKFGLGFEFDRFVFDEQYDPPNPERHVFRFTQDGDDIGVGATIGALIPISGVNVGVAYKRSPRFEFSSFSGGAVGSQQRTVDTFKVPDTLAIGVSAMINDRFLVTTEYTRVFHSQLRSDYVVVLARQGESRPRLDRFTIDDANEFHVGVEYLLPLPKRPAIRGGFWFDPDHSVHYDPTAAYDFLDERIDVSLSSGRDLWHYTLGTMFAVHPRIDISAALDRSARSTVVSTSASIRF
jgi:hypothetical protein